nr:uncharacterized protein LOC122270717 [Parasteatoda tepidariorum]
MDHAEKQIMTLLIQEEEEEARIRLFFQNKEEDEIFVNRPTEGTFAVLIQRHLMFNDEKFRQYFRFSIELLQELFNLIEGSISYRVCNRRQQPVSKKEKLCLTLRYLATGESYRSLAFNYRICHS